MMSATNIPHRIRTKVPSPSSFAIRVQANRLLFSRQPPAKFNRKGRDIKPIRCLSMQCRLHETRTRNVRPRSRPKQRKRPIRSLEWTSLPRRRESVRPPRESWAGLDRRGHSAHNVFSEPPRKGVFCFLDDWYARQMASGQMASATNITRIKTRRKRLRLFSMIENAVTNVGAHYGRASSRRLVHRTTSTYLLLSKT